MIYRGDINGERLYLFNLKSDCCDGLFVVRSTKLPDMPNLIARHQGRYMFAASFCRPGMKVLDFPCGSGYGKSILCHTPIEYEGIDNDHPTIQYAIEYYGDGFFYGDMTKPDLRQNYYDLIVCIEGIEHIDILYQKGLITAFKTALKNDGKLIITSPERKEQITNPYHKWEMNKSEFEEILKEHFSDIQILSIKDRLHDGVETNLLWGICQNDGSNNL